MPIPVTTTRRMRLEFLYVWWRPGRAAAARVEFAKVSVANVLVGRLQQYAKIFRGVDNFAISFQHAVGFSQFQFARNHAFDVDHVLNVFDVRCDFAREFDVANARCTALSRQSKPAEEKPRELPKRIQSEAPRHNGVALKMAIEKPVQSVIPGDLQLGNDLTFAVRATRVGDVADGVEHQHRGQRQLRVALAEQLAATARQQIIEIVA